MEKIKQQIQTTKSLKSLVQVYEEIAVMEMREIRTSVLNTRDFLKAISGVFEEVKSSYRARIERIIEKKGKKAEGKYTFSTLKRNGKTVSILLTSNERLSGPISIKVFDDFIEEVKKEETDIVVVGKVGKDLVDFSGLNKEYEYFSFPEESDSTEDLENIISYIINYEKVNVFHGKYANLVNQISIKTNISGEYGKEREEQSSDKKYLFEPSLEEVLNFFEVQIFSSLFKQSVKEANLAKLGSRTKAMEQASSNAEEKIKNLKQKQKRLKKNEENKKQLQRLAGMGLW